MIFECQLASLRAVTVSGISAAPVHQRYALANLQSC